MPTLPAVLDGLTQTIELATSILILPQRRIVPVAKQASVTDLLTGGRLRLGIGVDWNPVEFEALGEDFHDRGLRKVEFCSKMDWPSCSPAQGTADPLEAKRGCQPRPWTRIAVRVATPVCPGS